MISAGREGVPLNFHNKLPGNANRRRPATLIRASARSVARNCYIEVVAAAREPFFPDGNWVSCSVMSHAVYKQNYCEISPTNFQLDVPTFFHCIRSGIYDRPTSRTGPRFLDAARRHRSPLAVCSGKGS
ncbi:hypothetical protein EVAR_61592_1 [Eumeta japonica]|uniref:Uncharacterized protein n=1 Tax=Eumeta variegata TaxID=151549 RepID=A0A4C1YLV1_EUMVA|nr:hypothetical protein EVAR_61592_1 [Eumeta japonica]